MVPKVDKKLKELEVDANHLVAHWFICAFTSI